MLPVRQLIPGVLLMPPDKLQGYSGGVGQAGAMVRPGGHANNVANHSARTIATIARELLETRTSTVVVSSDLFEEGALVLLFFFF